MTQNKKGQILYDRYISAIRKSMFDFSGKYKFIAIFTNPNFFVRYHLFENIKQMSKELSGDLLDFGCGAKPYRELFTRCDKYVGCDITDSGHDHVNEDIDVYYDGVSLPFKDESFDSIFSSEVFEHVINLEVILPELNRVLKRGGKMLITVPFVWNEHEIPYDFRRYTSYGIKKALNKYGFRVVKYKKSCSYVEMVFQMWCEYLRSTFAERVSSRRMKIVFQRFVIAPVTLMGIISSIILPKSYMLYGDNVVLCIKN